MKKLLFLTLIMIVSILSVSFADIIVPEPEEEIVAKSESIEATLCCSRAITYNKVFQLFYNAKGDNVYPISYNGSTYLPIRAISSMFKIGITWDGTTSSIYLGKGEQDKNSSKESDVRFYVPVEKIEAISNADIKIYFNDEIQSFTDANGKIVYPISYKGTTYLPVRAIANLFEAEISYDQAQDLVSIFKKDSAAIQAYNSTFIAYEGEDITPNETKSLITAVVAHNANKSEVEAYGQIQLEGTNSASSVETGTRYVIKITKYNDQGFVSNISINKSVLKKKGTVKIKSLNMRTTPSDEGDHMIYLEQNDKFKVVGESEDKQWLQIEVKGRTGWIKFNTEYISIEY